MSWKWGEEEKRIIFVLWGRETPEGIASIINLKWRLFGAPRRGEIATPGGIVKQAEFLRLPGADFNRYSVSNGRARERARQRAKLVGYISEELREKVYERDGYKCKWCGSTKNLSLDHIVPVTKDGDTTENNLQTLCRGCNSSKSNWRRTPGNLRRCSGGDMIKTRNGMWCTVDSVQDDMVYCLHLHSPININNVVEVRRMASHDQ